MANKVHVIVCYVVLYAGHSQLSKLDANNYKLDGACRPMIKGTKGTYMYMYDTTDTYDTKDTIDTKGTKDLYMYMYCVCVTD